MIVVIAINPQNLPNEFTKAIDERGGVYEKAGAGQLLELNTLETTKPFGLDLALIDTKHASISFARSFGIERPTGGVLFRNGGQLVADLASWFDNFILREAEPYQAWKTRRGFS